MRRALRQLGFEQIGHHLMTGIRREPVLTRITVFAKHPVNLLSYCLTGCCHSSFAWIRQYCIARAPAYYWHASNVPFPAGGPKKQLMNICCPELLLKSCLTAAEAKGLCCSAGSSAATGALIQA
jgi:hypothetical protein